MTAKNYLTNTPLVLTNPDGTSFRVERGEVVELSPEQFEQVAAHVIPVEVVEETESEQPENQSATTESQTETPPAESANATTSTHLTDEQSENPPENTEAADKPKRGKTKE